MVEIISDVNKIRLIKKDCNRLAESFRMPLLQYEWLIHCAESLIHPAELMIILVRNSDKIKALAPMVMLRHNGIKKLEFIGTSLHGEPGGFLYEDEDSLSELIEAILNLKYPVSLNGIRATSTESAILEGILRMRNITFLTTNRYIPWLPLTGTWDEFMKYISQSRRSSLKRLRKMADREGEVLFEFVSPEKKLLNKYLIELFKIESSGWKKRMGTALLKNSQLSTFFKNYAEETLKKGMLRVCFLSINGIKVATQIGVIYSNRFWLLKIGYDEKWSKISPGILLMNEVIRHAFEEKLEAIEFMGSDESWLHIWTNSFHNLVCYNIYNSTLTAFINLGVEFSNSVFNRMRISLAKKKLNMSANYV